MVYYWPKSFSSLVILMGISYSSQVLLLAGFLIKLALFPFRFWYLNLLIFSEFYFYLVLSTIQKVIIFYFLRVFSFSKFFLKVLFLRRVFFGLFIVILVFQQSKFLLVLGRAGILDSCFLLLFLDNLLLVWFYYFCYFTILLKFWGTSLKQNLGFLFLVLSGLPPFLFFFIKVSFLLLLRFSSILGVLLLILLPQFFIYLMYLLETVEIKGFNFYNKILVFLVPLIFRLVALWFSL